MSQRKLIKLSLCFFLAVRVDLFSFETSYFFFGELRMFMFPDDLG